MSTSQQMSMPNYPAPYSPLPPSSTRRAQTVAGVVFGVIGGLALAGAGIIAVAVTRDADGYLTSDPGRLATDTHAVVVSSLEVNATGTGSAWLQQLVGPVRLTVDGQGDALFVGVAPSDKVAEYLGSVSYDEVEDFRTSPFHAEYRAHAGGEPTEAPAAQDFWVATATSGSPQVLSWEPFAGDWSVVLMNADGSANVSGYVTVGTTLPVLDTIVVAMGWGGGAFLAIGLVLVVGAAVGRSRDRRTSDQQVYLS